MSEADTPNNQPLPEPTASTDDSTAMLPDAKETPEASQIVKFVVEHSETEQDVTLESGIIAIASSPVEADDPVTETRTKDADWFALIQKMRQRNRRLLDQMGELRQTLREKQETLQLEQMRSRDQETLLVQQTEEISTLQEQLSRLFHALESSHQAAQRQQILIETLSEQLQSSQERVAQLERECSLVQQRYNEQSHQLLQAANTCRELRTRLQRQQRQTLQFKVALEKSLEMTASSNAAPPQQPRQRSGVVPKAQPIQPWSAAPEVDEDISSFDTLWKQPIRLEATSTEFLSDTEPSEVRGSDGINLPSQAEASEPVEIVVAKRGSVSEAELFGTAAIASSPDTDAIELELEQELLDELTSLAQASGLTEFQADLANAQTNVTPEPEISPEESSEATLSPSDVEQTLLSEDAYELDTELETPNEDLWEDSSADDPDQSDEVILPQPNWPSPVLYPLRSPKKRNSLAAIDLPSFPRYRPS
jgi:myosin heavy subunit